MPTWDMRPALLLPLTLFHKVRLVGDRCRVGAMLGNEFATKGGVGSASVDLGDGLIVSALMVVNAVGDVIDENGQILAGLSEIHLTRLHS